MAPEQTFVIVGGGLAGAKAAETLRAEGFEGRVVLVGAEAELPYERPPLSKGFLLGEEDQSKLFVHGGSWYTDHEVELVLGQPATDLDPARRRIRVGADRIGYTKLLLATGASPRHLRGNDAPAAESETVYHLRQLADAQRLRESLRRGGRVVVVGGGWIGLETAAAARHHGCEVTVLEPQTTPLQTTLGERIGGFFADVHRAHGVTFHLGTGVADVRRSGQGAEVETADGTVLAADTVIVGIGARPITELADQAGLRVENGVVVDAALRTSDPHIYAAGDVAAAFHPTYRRHLRVEHWANALHQGPAAARAMLGQDVRYDRLPYFFTDQYDLGMEFTGWFSPGAYDQIVLRGELGSRAFQAFWITDHRVVAGMHVNRWDDGLTEAKDLIRNHTLVDPDRLARDDR
jgi:3-phenylpropionate/trans-cinnamate dioxygenase ferredoxin reductase subunit